MSSRPTVLAYHSVGARPDADDPHGLFVSAARLTQHLDTLAHKECVVPLREALNGSSGHGVALTFDDGYRSVLEVAAPLLHERGIPATVFVPTKYIGLENRWDGSGVGMPIMDAHELRAIEALGVTVESHGHAHIDMETASDVEILDDMMTSREILAAILGRPPRFLAYPYGRSSERARKLAARAGFEAAFSIDRLEEGPFARERVQVTNADGPMLFSIKVRGLYLRLRWSRVGNATYKTIAPAARRLLLRGS